MAKKSGNSNYHHEHHSFLLIVIGGFLIMVLALLLFGNQLFGGMFMSETSGRGDREARKMQRQERKQNKAEKQRVVIKDYTYTPATLTVSVGSEVTFVNRDSVVHTTVADDGSFQTKEVQPGDKDVVTFDTPGTYTYYCAQHPNMTGTIVVQ